MRGDFLSAVLFLLCIASSAVAETIAVTVKDSRGKPVRMRWFTRCRSPAPSGRTPPGRSRGSQHDKQFMPYVSAVQVGSPAQFPNKDTVKHHVYSFSPAKKFELPLYAGTPPGIDRL